MSNSFAQRLWRYSMRRVGGLANGLTWQILSRAPRHRSQDLAAVQAILRFHGCDIARSPLLARQVPQPRRVPEDQELFRRIYADFASIVRTDFARCFLLFTQARRVVRNEVIGDFAELGVYKGWTARVLREAAPERDLHLFDTFQGQPANADRSKDGDRYVAHLKGSPLADTSVDQVRAFLGDPENVHYHVGYFPESVRNQPDRAYSLVHLDGDQYETMRNGCEYFFPLLATGGALICHDYGIFEGVKQAIDGYFCDRPEVVIEYPDAMGSVVIVKTQRE